MTAATGYEAFQARRAGLADLTGRARLGFAALDMAGWAAEADRLADRLASDRFRVMVLGEFKRGKSTFINALLHAEILPAEITPCTAVINEIKFAETRRAVLHFRHPPPDRHPPLPADARRHVARHAPGAAPPMDIPVADLPEFVKIPDAAASAAESVAESPYERVEVYWPLELCRHGTEIIDSPGLNEHQTRTRTTRDYLPHVDAVLFVMSVAALAGESELQVIDGSLRPAGHDHLFFVCNRFDELRKREDREKVQAYAYAKLADRTRFGREGVFFLSALDALEGRLHGDAAMVARSGILPLEQALERFLVEDRGRVKLLQPAAQLARGVRSALTEVIPARRRLFDEDLGALQQRLDEATPALDQAARRRDGVLKQVDNARRRVREAVRAAADQFFAGLAIDAPLWARRMDTTKVNAYQFWNVKDQKDQVALEVLSGLQPQLEASLSQWERARLRPLIEEEMKELAASVEMSVQPFLEYLDGIKTRLEGRLGEPARQADDTFARVLVGTGGAVLGAGLILASLPGMGAAVAAVGVTGVATVMATKVGALLLSMANPVTLAGAVVGTAVLGHRRGAALTEQVKLEVAQRVAQQLQGEARERSAAIADEVFKQTQPLADGVALELDRELHRVREQVDAVVQNKQRSEADVRLRRDALDRDEAELRKVEGELNDLILLLSQRG